jgi:hypothetical protein
VRASPWAISRALNRPSLLPPTRKQLTDENSNVLFPAGMRLRSHR